MAVQMITQEVVNGRPCYCAVRRGVSYVASELGGQWFVSSRRLALGRWNTGGGKYYASLDEVSRGCKAFEGLADLVAAPAVGAA